MNLVSKLFFKGKKKKLFGGFLVFFLLFNFLVIFLPNNRAEASVAPSESFAFYNRVAGHLEGWLWSDGIGWISLNCLTDPACDPARQYKVSIDGQGNFSGWAWSNTLGWLSFDRSVTGNPPGEPYQLSGAIARHDNSDGKIRGWARFTAAMQGGAGGWDGWVKLRCHGAECLTGWSDTRDGSGGLFVRNNRLGGWAWGGAVVNWISAGTPLYDEHGANVRGWAWSQNIGWISFNNNDPSESLAIYNRTAGHLEGWIWSGNIGWISLNCSTNAACNNADPARRYKVSIDDQGNFSGWAWSANLGWLSFDRSVTGTPPGEPYQSSGAIARYYSSDEKIRGWARFTAAMQGETGGWDGWIKLRCHGGECHHGWPDTTDGSGGLFVSNNRLDGWAWGGTVVGWISPWSPGAMHYGLNIDPTTYKLSGHVWSEHVGWISFNREMTGAPPTGDVCPDGSCLGLLNTTTHELNGWARALNHDDGWNGWIRLNGVANGVPYAPKLNLNTGRFHGWAYGGEVIGWISLNSANETGGPTYYVHTTLNIGPRTTNLREEWNYCLATRHPLLLWDVTGGGQGGYVIEIYSDSGLNSLVYRHEAESITSSHRPNINAGTCNAGGNGFRNAGVCNLEYTRRYWWRVKARPADGQFGVWSEAKDFTIQHIHHWPTPNFSYNPEQVSAGARINFNSANSRAFGAASINAWRWSVDNPHRFEGGTTSSQNPVIVFENQATYRVTLEVWDSIGYGPCALSRNINVADRMSPRWIEISPTQ